MTIADRDDDLLRAFIDNTLDDHTHQLLQDRLLTDPGLRRDCLQLLQIDALLSWRSGSVNSALQSNPVAVVNPHESVQPRLQRQPRPNGTVGEKNTTPPSRVDSKRIRFRSIRLGLAAASVLFLLGGVLLLANHLRNSSEIPSEAIAKLQDVIVESGQTLLINAEDFFGRKILTHEAASAVITFADGTEVVLESDAQLMLDKADAKKGKELQVYAGQVKVSASPQPKDRPLKINSPHGIITVFGTEFLLSVAQQGTTIGLLEGVVNLTRFGDNATLQLLAGQRATLAPETTLAATPLKFSNSGLWTPEKIKTSAWYDADDDVSIVAQADVRNGRIPVVKVVQWNDKSGNGNHLFAQGPGTAVLERTADLKNIIKFQAPPNLQSTKNICTQPFSFAIVAGPAKVFRVETPLFAGNGPQPCMLTGFSNKVTMNAGLSGPSLTKGPGFFIATGVFDGASSRMHINGKAPAFGNTGSGDLSQGITIGRGVDSDPNSRVNGNMCEIIIIPGIWSAAEQQKVEGYLAHKWGVGLVPSHPFKKTPPKN